MGTLNLSTLFGTSTSSATTNSGGAWNRPTHETTCQMPIYPGGNCCFSVPSNASRIVIEMWGQGGGGSGACCCQWPMTGGRGGDYAYKVFTNLAGTQHFFCGCVCTCDCNSYDATGSPGQFSKLTQCTGAGWVGCASGGNGGSAYCTATCWWGTSYGGYTCNTQYNTCVLSSSAGSTSSYPAPNADNSIGPSCLCGGSGICVGASNVTNAINFTTASSGGTSNTALDTIFQPITCGCWDAYRRGACGFTFNTGCTDGGSCCSMLGVGGAAYAGGAQQNKSCTTGPAFCGHNGNFPGGGGRGSGAFGGGCCWGGAGGGGLILLSYKI